jgi:hypothetical protein
MRLLTVGDSFTYGEELSDLNNAWPYLLGQQLGWTVTNLGQPASGNTRMIRTVVEEIDRHDVFIIAWSHWGRIEFADDYGTFDIWPGCNPAPHQQLTPHRTQLIEYISRHHSDDYLIRQFLLNIILLQNYLSQKNKKYLMLTAFGEYSSFLKEKYSDLINQIDTTYYVEWTETMMEWTWRANCSKGPNGHFLEHGHRVVSDKIYEHIRHLGWIS